MEASRRTITKGAAWAIPTLAIGTAAPAVAASRTPCGTPTTPAVRARTYNVRSSKTQTQAFSGVYSTCADPVPAGIVFDVTWCNSGTASFQIANTYSHNNLALVSGQEGTKTLAPGTCQTWRYRTTATLPTTAGLSLNLAVTNPATVTATVQVITMPTGYTNTDPANGADTFTFSV